MMEKNEKIMGKYVGNDGKYVENNGKISGNDGKYVEMMETYGK